MSTVDLAPIVADLQRRLGEAEETIRAIRDGEVDALVIRGGGAEEIFTITGADEGYRGFMEAMDLGALALDDGGRVVYANAALCGLLRTTLREVQGKMLVDLLGPTNRAAAEALLSCTLGERRSCEVELGQGPGALHLIANSAPLRVGTIAGHAVTLTDVTERIRSEEIRKSEQIARAVISCANEAMFVCDREGVITHASASASGLSETDLIGRPFSEVVPLVVQAAPGLMQADDVITLALDGSSVRGIEVSAPKAPKSTDYLVSAAPLRLSESMVTGCVVTLTDLTSRKAAEKQQSLLMAELDHRVKNILTLVLSIARKMARTTHTLEGFHAGIIGRIEALAATHKLLADKAWRGLSIKEIVATELAPYVDTGGRKVSLSGLDILVSARSAIALGLVIHELATNAAKYGALSDPRGRVAVSAGSPADGLIAIEWRETDGPAVRAPSRTGFGQTVISRSLQYAPGGGAEVRYEPAGVICRMVVPLDEA